MIDERILIFAACLILCSLAMFGLHERHYRKRRDTVRDARLQALEAQVSPERRGELLEARLRAVEGILLEDVTT